MYGVVAVISGLFVLSAVISAVSVGSCTTKKESEISILILVLSIFMAVMCSHHLSIMLQCEHYEKLLVNTGKYMRVNDIKGGVCITEVATPTAEVIIDLPMEVNK